jgi:hypothetical protein
MKFRIRILYKLHVIVMSSISLSPARKLPLFTTLIYKYPRESRGDCLSTLSDYFCFNGREFIVDKERIALLNGPRPSWKVIVCKMISLVLFLPGTCCLFIIYTLLVYEYNRRLESLHFSASSGPLIVEEPLDNALR